MEQTLILSKLCSRGEVLFWADDINYCGVRSSVEEASGIGGPRNRQDLAGVTLEAGRQEISSKPRQVRTMRT